MNLYYFFSIYVFIIFFSGTLSEIFRTLPRAGCYGCPTWVICLFFFGFKHFCKVYLRICCKKNFAYFFYKVSFVLNWAPKRLSKIRTILQNAMICSRKQLWV